MLDAALERDEFDFVEEIASEIPMQVFAEILGVPQDDRRHIIDLGDRLLGNQDPEYFVPPDPSHRLLPFSSPAALEMFEFGRKMAAARRKEPGNDIITQLAFEPLTQREFDVYFVLLATAGNETTRHTITHGLLALLRAPRPAAAAARRPRALQAGGRGDAALGDARAPLPPHDDARRPSWRATTIPRRRQGHDLVRVGQPRRGGVRGARHASTSARTPNKHMAFGPGGIHHCMGAHLARMEVRIAFEELLKRVKTIELAGPPERLRSNFFNGIKRLPVRVTR